MDVISYSKSGLIGTIMESMAYGMYFILFIQSMTVLKRRFIDGRLSFYLAVTSIVLFILITMRMVLDNMLNIGAFTGNPELPNAAEINFTSFDGALHRTGTYITLTIVADLFIVYRVFVVWANSWIAAAVPAVLAGADIVAGVLFLTAITKLIAGSSPNGNEVGRTALIFYSFTMALNVISTFLIALRVYLLQRSVAKASEGITGSFFNASNSIAILIESAALYSVTLIATIVPTAMETNVQYCLLSVLPGVIGISFTLIITRVGSGLSPDTAAPGAVSSLQFGHIRRSAVQNRAPGGITSISQDSGEEGGSRKSDEENVRVHLSPHSKDQTTTATTRHTGNTSDPEKSQTGTT